MVFQNLNPDHRRPGLWDVFRWSLWDRITRRRRTSSPGPPASSVEPDVDLIQSRAPGARLTWIGHASFLATIDDCHILIDPVFSQKIGGFYRRHAPPGLALADLPNIDLILITHNHYDHLDAPSIEGLSRSATVVCPMGLGGWFKQFEFARIIELDWWETSHVHEVKVTFTPSRHWSKRRLFDTNRSLWGGYVIEHPRAQLYHAGDSAWCNTFQELEVRFPNLDVAMISIGGYEPTWFMERNHLNPEQAGQAFLDCGATQLVPMHYGTFQMTDEPLIAPLARLNDWWESLPIEIRQQRKLAPLSLGETLTLSAR